MSSLLYNINEKPKKWYQWIAYPIQMVLSVIVATILIANICGTPVDACLIGACVGTLIYQLITKFKSPMFISSCGATVSAVIGALALGNGNNYLAVAIGGLIILIVYAIFAALVKFGGVQLFNKIFPPLIVGPITMVIGLNLAGFLPTYIGTDIWPMLVALFTMLITAILSHYCKGFMKTIAFLIGIASGYTMSLILTKCNIYNFIQFEEIKHIIWYPDFSFLHWNFNFNVEWLIDIALLFIPVSICAVLEHYSDHKCLSNILDVDLTSDPGLDKTLLGDGVASAVGSIVCGLPNTSYGESIATIGFSKVGSVIVSTIAAIILGVLAFIEPVRIFLQSIPSCVFGGCAMILYGYIAASGLKTLVNSKPDLEDSKTLIIISVILTIGVSGIYLWSESFTGVALAMVVGVILNLLLYKKKNKEIKIEDIQDKIIEDLTPAEEEVVIQEINKPIKKHSFKIKD